MSTIGNVTGCLNNIARLKNCKIENDIVSFEKMHIWKYDIRDVVSVDNNLRLFSHRLRKYVDYSPDLNIIAFDQKSYEYYRESPRITLITSLSNAKNLIDNLIDIRSIYGCYGTDAFDFASLFSIGSVLCPNIRLFEAKRYVFGEPNDAGPHMCFKVDCLEAYLLTLIFPDIYEAFKVLYTKSKIHKASMYYTVLRILHANPDILDRYTDEYHKYMIAMCIKLNRPLWYIGNSIIDIYNPTSFHNQSRTFGGLYYAGLQ